MTVLYGALKDVARQPFDQLGTAVVISATQARPELEGSGLILTELCRIPMEDTGGIFETDDLDPGPVIVRIEGGVSHGQQWQIGIPMEGRWNLADLIGEQVEWEPIVVSRAEAAARDSRLQADRSETEADRAERAADRVGSAERVLEAETNSAASASAAATSATASAGSASASATSATEAATSAGEAADSATNAADSATSAAANAEQTTADVATSLEHRTATETARTTTETYRNQAREARDEAQAAQTTAEEARDDAQAAQSGAEASATSAAQTVTDAVAEVTGITAGHADRAETAASAAQASKTAASASATAAAESAESAADIALGSIPDATSSTKGLVTLAGDLAGTGAAPRVPGLALVAPGASLPLVPPGEGWSNATGTPASVGHHMDKWLFDGTWLEPPAWLGKVHVTVDWCGRSSVVLRGERQDSSVSTLATIPALDPEEHRQVTVVVDLAVTPRLAVAGTWTAEDLDAGCAASLLVRPMPEHSHAPEEVTGLDQLMASKVDGNDPRLSDSRTPRTHTHTITQVTGLEDELGGKASTEDVSDVQSLVSSRPAMYLWDGVGEWSAPEGASIIDTVLNLDSGEVHAITEVE